MSVGVHIFTAETQPAIRFVDRHGAGRPIVFRSSPRKQIPALCCRRRRWAKNLSVQVFYDSVNFFCAAGRGCKAKKAARK